MLRIFLERLLVGPVGLQTVGLPLPIAGGYRMLFGGLSNLLSDGDGHRMGLDWKGASSLKPCFKHVNVFKKDRFRRARSTGQRTININVCSLMVLARRLRSAGQRLGPPETWLRRCDVLRPC